MQANNRQTPKIRKRCECLAFIASMSCFPVCLLSSAVACTRKVKWQYNGAAKVSSVAKEAHGQQQNTQTVLLALVKHYRFAHQLTITDTVRGIRACMLMTMRYFDGQCVCTITYVTAKVTCTATAKTTIRLYTVPLKPCLQCAYL
jgi:hypothetical protein